MFSPAGFEQLASAISGIDFPPGSVRVLFAEHVPPAVRNFAGNCLAWTSPDADVVCGLASTHAPRVSAIVIDPTAIRGFAMRAGLCAENAILGSFVHELGHVATFPRPVALSPSPERIAEVQAFAVNAAAHGGAAAPGAEYHGANWRRATAYISRRVESMGLVPCGFFPPSTGQAAPAVGLDPVAFQDYFYTGSIRELVAMPTPDSAYTWLPYV